MMSSRCISINRQNAKRHSHTIASKHCVIVIATSRLKFIELMFLSNEYATFAGYFYLKSTESRHHAFCVRIELCRIETTEWIFFPAIVLISVSLFSNSQTCFVHWMRCKQQIALFVWTRSKVNSMLSVRLRSHPSREIVFLSHFRFFRSFFFLWQFLTKSEPRA